MKLYNDDCFNVLNDKNIKVDAIITDLPYFQVVKNNWDNQWQTVDDYLQWIDRLLILMQGVLKDNASIIMFTGRQLNRHIAIRLDNYFNEERIIIWNRKRNFNTTRGKALASGYEPICFYSQGVPTFNNLKILPNTKRKEYTEGILKSGVSLSDSWSDIPALVHNSKEKVAHPTQKPLQLMERIIKMCSNENDVILDPFMGSGTTGLACKNLNRRFIGIENELEYFNIAKERLEL